MGYDIYITKGSGKKTETVQLPEKHDLHGGTYCLGGTTEAHLSETFNYSKHFCSSLGGNGINDLDGKLIKDTIPLLDDAIYKLRNGKTDPDYWKATEGNARAALFRMKQLAELALYHFPNVKTLRWAIER